MLTANIEWDFFFTFILKGHCDAKNREKKLQKKWTKMGNLGDLSERAKTMEIYFSYLDILFTHWIECRNVKFEEESNFSHVFFYFPSRTSLSSPYFTFLLVLHFPPRSSLSSSYFTFLLVLHFPPRSSLFSTVFTFLHCFHFPPLFSLFSTDFFGVKNSQNGTICVLIDDFLNCLSLLSSTHVGRENV